MTNREIKIVNRKAWVHGSRGYLRRCRSCANLIYLKRDYDGRWRPYESWAAGNVDEDEWQLHNCPALGAAA